MVTAQHQVKIRLRALHLVLDFRTLQFLSIGHGTMLEKLTLILGGAASGKSAFAENLVMRSKSPRAYLATAQPFDPEMLKKIKAHRKMRGNAWRTIETPLNAAEKLARISSEEVVLVDCATMWLSNHLLADHDIAEESARLLQALAACPGRVVVVSNEVGLDVVPDNALARRFRDAQGTLNQQLADQSSVAVLVVAGLPLVLKGALQ